MPRYFLKMNFGNSPEVEVTEEEFCNAERASGFRPKKGCGPTATAGFSSGAISGRVEFPKDDREINGNKGRDFSPYFDQEAPEIPIKGMIASLARSPRYELDAAAVFKGNRLYLVVKVSGCSCWPDRERGTTEQTVCHTKADVDKVLHGWSELISECQQNNWKVKP